MRRILLCLVFTHFITMPVSAQDASHDTLNNIHYYSETVKDTDVYINERCVLDLYYPKNINGYATIVWFHGSGLFNRMFTKIYFS